MCEVKHSYSLSESEIHCQVPADCSSSSLLGCGCACKKFSSWKACLRCGLYSGTVNLNLRAQDQHTLDGIQLANRTTRLTTRQCQHLVDNSSVSWSAARSMRKAEAQALRGGSYCGNPTGGESSSCTSMVPSQWSPMQSRLSLAFFPNAT